MATQSHALSLPGYWAIGKSALGKDTGRSLVAGLLLRWLVSGLRHTHAVRAALCADRCSDRQQTWRISRGKTHQRAAFFVAIPTHLDSQTPFFHDLHTKLAHLLGEKNAAEYFLSEVAVGPSSWTVRAEHMPIARAQLVLREALQNLGHKSEANTATTYSLRRFLPTVGDSLQLTCSERSSSGNWTDHTSVGDASSRKTEPMHIRYSDSRLE